MTFRRLLKWMLNRSKSPWRPRMRGVDSFAARSALTLNGNSPSFNVIGATNTATPCPSMPYERDFGRSESLSPKTSAKVTGSMVKSAPVSRRKSYDSYPRRVLMDTGMVGSQILPRSVLLSRNGNSIDADHMGGSDELHVETRPPFIVEDLFYEEARLFGMGDNSPLVSGNILPAILFLKGCVIDFRLHDSKTIMGVKSCQ